MVEEVVEIASARATGPDVEFFFCFFSKNSEIKFKNKENYQKVDSGEISVEKLKKACFFTFLTFLTNMPSKLTNLVKTRFLRFLAR